MISINTLCFLKASLVVVPIPHKLVMGILVVTLEAHAAATTPVVTLEAHAATTTPVVILAPSAVMTPRGDVCLFSIS